MQKLVNFLSQSLYLIYKVYLRPLFGYSCRYEPSCSCYARQAIKNHTFLKASVFILIRILRCQPFSAGGYDPVPLNKEIVRG